jgi:hypothetical protein
MIRLRPGARRLPFAAAAAALALGACNGDEPTASAPLAGTYVATTFQVTPAGQSTTDVRAAGGSLSLLIAPDNTTSGTLSIPPSLNGGTPLNASLAGTATRSGNTVRFTQSAATFVRDLTWTASGTTLQVTDQTAGSARFTITLTRQ